MPRNKTSYTDVVRALNEDFFRPAIQDVERIVGTELPNVTHYALLGRLNALVADVSQAVADVLTSEVIRR